MPRKRIRAEGDEFTVGQAAKLTGLSVREIARLCDAGMLSHWWTPTKRRERRIERASLVALIQDFGLPMPPELR
jgi:excisionase family DNA binding protein